jgi:hypothetical protein
MSKPLPKQRKPHLTIERETYVPFKGFVMMTEPRWFNYGLPPTRKHTYIIRRIRTRRNGQMEMAL